MGARIRHWAAVATVVVAGCSACATAQASTVTATVDDGVRFTAAPGERNTVTALFTYPYTEFVVADTTAVLTAGPGCVQRDTHRAVCDGSATHTFVAYLGDQDDSLIGTPFDAFSTVHAGPGNDRVVANSNILEVHGEDGNDDLSGAGNGSWTADGGNGNDRITSPFDSVNAGGGRGDDTLLALAGSLSGGPGDDTLGGTVTAGGTGGALLLQGDDGNDRLTGSVETDLLEGGAGNDALSGGPAADTFSGGAGTDLVSYAERTAPLSLRLGEPGQGEAGEGDELGADVEQLVGGSGPDLLVGTAVANRLDGGPGADRLVGRAGDDALLGGEGDDLFDASSTAPDGGDYVQGGPGLDTISYAARADGPVRTSLGTGTRDDGAPGERDWVLGDVEQLIGSRFADVLSGTSGPNDIRGGAGDDAISGGDGADVLAGEAGADRVAGGRGADLIEVAGDRTADRVDCGQNGGTVPQTVLDSVSFDRLLDSTARCEVLQPR